MICRMLGRLMSQEGLALQPSKMTIRLIAILRGK
jgi:hypothetical protein